MVPSTGSKANAKPPMHDWLTAHSTFGWVL
jgi:hypothetical protein